MDLDRIANKKYPKELFAALAIDVAASLPDFTHAGYLNLSYDSIQNYWEIFRRCGEVAEWVHETLWTFDPDNYLFFAEEVVDFLLVQELVGTVNRSNYSEEEIEDAVMGLIVLSLEYSHQLAGVLNAKTQTILDTANASRTHVGQELAEAVFTKWVDVFEKLKG
ncbi:MAG: hypothetical protein AAF902_11530 [Chloroflexota bacterium]